MKPEQLKSLRKLSGLTQARLGVLMGYKTQINKLGTETCHYIYMIESGRRKSSNFVALKWCQALGLSISFHPDGIYILVGKKYFEVSEYIKSKENETSI